MKTHFLASATISMICLFLIAFTVGCSNSQEEEAHDESESVSESVERSGEKDSEHQGESHDESGEEDGTQYALDETYDQARLGTRLVLSFDAESNVFSGYIENTSSETLHSVRVEIHLSNGIELGPTDRINLMPGQKVDVSLRAELSDFEGFSAHAEVGESGEEGEHSGDEGEHSEREDEHSEEGEEH